MKRYVLRRGKSLAAVAFCGCFLPGEASPQGVTSSVVEATPVWKLEGGQPGRDAGWSFIADAAASPDGVLALADPNHPSITLVDPDGRSLRQIGPTGVGSRLVRQPSGLAWLTDGRLAVWDPANRSVTILSVDGEVLAGVPFDSGLVTDDPFHADSEDRFYVRAMRDNGDEIDRRWLVGSLSRGVFDSIPISPPYEHPFISVNGAQPFYEGNFSTIGRGGELVFGHNGEYSIRVVSGPDTIVVARRFRPLPVPVGEFQQWVGFTETTSCSYGGRVSFPTPPRWKPAYRRLIVDSDGRLWVWRYVRADSVTARPGREVDGCGRAPAYHWREQPTFDVFAQDGSYLATVKLPMDALFLDSVRDRVWVRTRRESGRETLEMLRVSFPPLPD